MVMVDDKHRVLLTREVRKKAGISKGDRLLAIPFSGGVTLVVLGHKRFAGYLQDLVYDEEAHEAAKYLFGEGRKECQS